MERKISEHFCYEGLGFPVHMLNIPIIKTRGTWTPDIDYNELQKTVLIAIATKISSLTGNEIRFVRKYFRKTLEAFGQEFGVSHVAVLDWEKEENNPIKINPATEKCIRLFIIDELHVVDHKFRESYQCIKIKELAEQQKAKKKLPSEPLTFDARKVFQPYRRKRRASKATS